MDEPWVAPAATRDRLTLRACPQGCRQECSSGSGLLPNSAGTRAPAPGEPRMGSRSLSLYTPSGKALSSLLSSLGRATDHRWSSRVAAPAVLSVGWAAADLFSARGCHWTQQVMVRALLLPSCSGPCSCLESSRAQEAQKVGAG